ncbi:MAG: hypothetical protein AAF447_08095 [Myxococcota bacterium]
MAVLGVAGSVLRLAETAGRHHAQAAAFEGRVAEICAEAAHRHDPEAPPIREGETPAGPPEPDVAAHRR